MMMMSKAVSAIASHYHQHRVLDQLLERVDQHGAKRAVDGAVIARHGRAHDLRGLDLAVAHDGTLLARADRKDRRLRWVDHRGEVLDAVHAEIGHRRRAALV